MDRPQPARPRHFHSYNGGKVPRAKRKRQASFGGQLLVVSGLAAIAAWNFAPQLTSAWTIASTDPEDVFAIENSAYYLNCSAARAAGAAPIYRGEPGYRDKLDGDSDGIACEPYRGY